MLGSDNKKMNSSIEKFHFAKFYVELQIRLRKRAKRIWIIYDNWSVKDVNIAIKFGENLNLLWTLKTLLA